MAFTVETGSGLPNANSLVSLDFFTEYCEDFGYDVQSNWDDTRKQAALVKATSYLDAFYGTRFDGYPLLSGQSLCWPRRSATYRLNSQGQRGSVTPGEIPVKVQQAICELAVIADTADLTPNITAQDLNVVSQKVGPIEIKFNSTTRVAVTMYRRAALLLSPYVAMSNYNIGMTRG